jgi:hypothetical protein
MSILYFPILFPEVKTTTTVDECLIELKKYMYTVEYKMTEAEESVNISKKLFPKPNSGPEIKCSLTSISGSKFDSHDAPPNPDTPSNIPIAHPPVIVNNNVKKTLYTGSPEQSLFWSVFIATKGYGEYMREQRRAANVWIEERLRIVDALKVAPKQMKESNHKLTLEKIQALFSGMLTSRQDKEEDAILYSAYYKIPIVILYDKTAVVFDNESNRWNPDQSDSKDTAIYLEAKPSLRTTRDGKKQVEYRLLDPTALSINNEIEKRHIVDNLTTGLRSVSTYKIDELRELFSKLEGPSKLEGSSIVKLTKPEIYMELKRIVAKDRFLI